jgi:hypothetical protein
MPRIQHSVTPSIIIAIVKTLECSGMHEGRGVAPFSVNARSVHGHDLIITTLSHKVTEIGVIKQVENLIDIIIDDLHWVQQQCSFSDYFACGSSVVTRRGNSIANPSRHTPLEMFLIAAR